MKTVQIDAEVDHSLAILNLARGSKMRGDWKSFPAVFPGIGPN